ncbi:MAG: glycosyl hydrolase family protein, partial [Bacteroidetes bacterium]
NDPNKYNYIGGSSDYFQFHHEWGPIFAYNCCPNGVSDPSNCSRDVSTEDQVSTVGGVLSTTLAHTPLFNFTPPWPFTDANCVVHTPQDPPLVFNFQSGHLHSNKNAGQVHYGYITLKIKVQNVDQIHGGFWLFSADSGWYNEIDIMESWTTYSTGGKIVTGRPEVSAGIHWITSKGKRLNTYNSQLPPTNNEINFVEYSVEWAPNYVIIYHDRVPVWHAAQEENTFDYIPKNKMTVILGQGIQRWTSLPNVNNLPATWQWDDYQSYYYSNINPNLNIFIISTPSLLSWTQKIPGSFNVSNCSNLTTSDNLQIRATDNVTLQRDVTISPTGDGSFTILTPNFDVYPPSY